MLRNAGVNLRQLCQLYKRRQDGRTARGRPPPIWLPWPEGNPARQGVSFAINIERTMRDT